MIQGFIPERGRSDCFCSSAYLVVSLIYKFLINFKFCLLYFYLIYSAVYTVIFTEFIIIAAQFNLSV